MRGLLLKDWYMMKKYCRAYLVIAAVFIAVSVFSAENLFFVFYPCMFCGMIPVSLLSYDERSRWLQYSATLPYTRAQIVSAKYMIGLLSQVVVLVLTGIAQSVRMIASGFFVFGDFMVLMLLLLTVSTVTSSISLPFIFKLGVEKGRTAYYAMILFVCGAGTVSSGLMNTQLQNEIELGLPLTIIALFGIGIYALSWYLSVVFYQKREL